MANIQLAETNVKNYIYNDINKYTYGGIGTTVNPAMISVTH